MTLAEWRGNAEKARVEAKVSWKKAQKKKKKDEAERIEKNLVDMAKADEESHLYREHLIRLAAEAKAAEERRKLQEEDEIAKRR